MYLEFQVSDGILQPGSRKKYLDSSEITGMYQSCMVKDMPYNTMLIHITILSRS